MRLQYSLLVLVLIGCQFAVYGQDAGATVISGDEAAATVDALANKGDDATTTTEDKPRVPSEDAILAQLPPITPLRSGIPSLDAFYMLFPALGSLLRWGSLFPAHTILGAVPDTLSAQPQAAASKVVLVLADDAQAKSRVARQDAQSAPPLNAPAMFTSLLGQMTPPNLGQMMNADALGQFVPQVGQALQQFQMPQMPFQGLDSFLGAPLPMLGAPPPPTPTPAPPATPKADDPPPAPAAPSVGAFAQFFNPSNFDTTNLLGQMQSQLPPMPAGTPDFMAGLRQFLPGAIPAAAGSDAQASDISEVRVKPGDQMAQLKIKSPQDLEQDKDQQNVPLLWFRLPMRDEDDMEKETSSKPSEDLRIKSKLQAFERQVIAELKLLQHIERLAKEMRVQASTQGGASSPYKISYPLSRTPVHKITRADIERALRDDYVRRLLHKEAQRKSWVSQKSKYAHDEGFERDSGAAFKRQANLSKDDIVKMMAYAYRMASEQQQQAEEKAKEDKIYAAYRATARQSAQEQNPMMMQQRQMAEEQARQQAAQNPMMMQQRQMAEEQAKAQQIQMQQRQMAEEQARQQAQGTPMMLQQRQMAEEQAKAQQIQMKQLQMQQRQMAEEQAKQQAAQNPMMMQQRQMMEEQAWRQAQAQAQAQGTPMMLQQRQMAEEQAKAQQIQMQQRQMAEEQAKAQQIQMQQLQMQQRQMAEEQAKQQAAQNPMMMQQRQMAEEQAKAQQIQMQQRQMAEEQAKAQQIQMQQLQMQQRQMAEEQAKQQAAQNPMMMQQRQMMEEQAWRQAQAQAQAQGTPMMLQQRQMAEEQAKAQQIQMQQLQMQQRQMAEEQAKLPPQGAPIVGLQSNPLTVDEQKWTDDKFRAMQQINLAEDQPLEDTVGEAEPQMPENAGQARHKVDLLGLGGNKRKKSKSQVAPPTIINYYQSAPAVRPSYGTSYGYGGYGSNAYGAGHSAGYRAALGNDEIDEMLRQHRTMSTINQPDDQKQEEQEIAGTMTPPTQPAAAAPHRLHKRLASFFTTLRPEIGPRTTDKGNENHKGCGCGRSHCRCGKSCQCASHGQQRLERQRRSADYGTLDKGNENHKGCGCGRSHCRCDKSCQCATHGQQRLERQRRSADYGTLETIDESSLNALRKEYRLGLKEITLSPDEDPAEALMRYNAASIREALERASLEPFEISGDQMAEGVQEHEDYQQDMDPNVQALETTTTSTSTSTTTSTSTSTSTTTTSTPSPISTTETPTTSTSTSSTSTSTSSATTESPIITITPPSPTDDLIQNASVIRNHKEELKVLHKIIHELKEEFATLSERCRNPMKKNTNTTDTESTPCQAKVKTSKQTSAANAIDKGDPKDWQQLLASRGYDTKYLTKTNELQYNQGANLELPKPNYESNLSSDYSYQEFPTQFAEDADTDAENKRKRATNSTRSLSVKEQAQLVNVELNNDPKEMEPSTVSPYALRGKFISSKHRRVNQRTTRQAQVMPSRKFGTSMPVSHLNSKKIDQLIDVLNELLQLQLQKERATATGYSTSVSNSLPKGSGKPAVITVKRRRLRRRQRKPSSTTRRSL